MNDVSNKEIEILVDLIEKRLNHVLKTPRDFDELSLQIKIRQNETISKSTIKRILGYVSDKHHPSHTTLSVLARFVGCRDWTHFKQCLAKDSAILHPQPNGKSIQSSTLTAGDEVEFIWEPERQCRLRYLGQMRYCVTSASNTQLTPGDTLTILTMTEGQPVIATEVTLGDRCLMAYVIGEENGVKQITIFPASTPSAE